MSIKEEVDKLLPEKRWVITQHGLETIFWLFEHPGLKKI